jgi:serine/threonine-protein kinase HipA
MGRLIREPKKDRMSFVYDEAWRRDATSFPLSLSMPSSAIEHAHDAVSPYLWGLLPDNDGVLRRWGERFHVSPGNVFRLLEHVGEDCAGAVQWVKPERTDAWRTASAKSRIQWLSDDDIAERLRLLLRDHSASRTGTDRGHFSLAGAQPKTALHYDPKGNRWGVPSGTIPTTHIFKPPTGDFDGYAENEHFCMSLARTLGIGTAASTLMRFGDVTVIVVDRFDRMRQGTRVARIHQEDMCQAMARMPQQKYQNQGGPAVSDILNLIRRHSSSRSEDEARFIDALIFNWLIMGTDAHAKNYAFLIGASGRVRLAPLYDLSSALPYPQQVHPRHATLAMKIGGKYKLREITLREWKKAAIEFQYDETALIERIRVLADSMPDAAAQVHKQLRAGGIRHDVSKRLVSALQERATACLSLVR